MTNNLYDITIIGGGPIGMFAGFYAGLRNAKAQIIESLPEMGGQVKALYPEKTILDVAGFAGLTGAELIANLQEQLDTMTAVEQKVATKVLNIKKVDAGFEITTNHGVSYSKAVILAAGNGSFKPRELRAENIDVVADQFISYSVTNLQKFAGKDVMVAGGGDSAVDMALLLETVANQVSILHRRAEFRGLEHMIDKLNESSVQILTPYLIKRLDQVDGRLQVTAKKVKTDIEDQFVVDDLVVNYGFISNNKDLQNFEVQPELEHNLVKVNSKQETSEPLMFSIGDQATYPGKDTLIATGLGEAPIAVNTIMKQLYPDQRLPIHSTSLHK